MLKFLPPTLLAASLVALGACQRPPPGGQEELQEPYLSVPNSVAFDIESQPTDNASQQWLATYTSQGKTAKFRIELGQAHASKARDKLDFDIESGEGRFIAIPGSDASVLLADLKKALEAKTLPAHPQRVATLPFTYVTFGKNQSQAPGGGFNANPAGHWTPMKIFLVVGEQEGEVFVNLNPVTNKGQFSIKDPDYCDIVLAQLAQVL